MIQLPDADGQTIRRALCAANQLLVNAREYELVKALLEQGKTARFRIKCGEFPGFFCNRNPDHMYEAVDVGGCLGDHIAGKIEPCACAWGCYFDGCVPRKNHRCLPKSQPKVVVYPTQRRCR